MNTKPYKDVRNKFRTESLFLETYSYDVLDPKIYQPVWTLKEFDHPLHPNHIFYDHFPDHTVPSLRRVYMAYSDPSEYKFAMEVLGSDRHWKLLTGLKFFQPLVAEWRESLQAKLQAEAVDTIRAISKSDSKSALQAAKWLAEKGYLQKDVKGRPSKQDIARKVVEEVTQDKMLKEDAERVGLA